MAGNKTLDKFKNSKIPKKGKGAIKKEIPVYQEPNSHSKIIGKINKDEVINWISKSICEGKEWIRCDQIRNFGYIEGSYMDGTSNLNMDTIQEKKEDKKENKNNLNNDIEITKEEREIAIEALRDILEDDKKDGNYNENDSLSTGNGNNSENSDAFDKNEDEFNKVFEDKNEEVFKEDNLDNLYYNGDIFNLDGAIKEHNKILEKNILNMMNNDKEKNDLILNALESFKDILPKQNSLSNKDLLLSTLDSIPGREQKNVNDKENEDQITMLSKGIDFIEYSGDGMEKIKGSVRLTDGKNNGNNFSPKYYESGWKGGSRAGIKTVNVAKIGKGIQKVAMPISLAVSGKSIIDAYKEDGKKLGDNTKKVFCEEVGSFMGGLAGAKMGSIIGGALLGPFGVIAGAIIGGFLGADEGENIGKAGGEKIIEKKEDIKVDKEEEKKAE